MDRRFLLLTALCSAGVFAGTWALAGAAPHGRPITAAPPATQPVYYAKCSEAWDAGAAPIYRGQPGYRPELDDDDDGIACEPYHGNGSYTPHGMRRRFRL